MSDNSNPNIRMLETKISQEFTEPTVYVNVANIAMSPEEVVLRFGLMNPEMPAEAAPVIRIYMSPGHAKRLAAAFNVAVGQYEATFGAIKEGVDLLTVEARQRLGMPSK